MRDFEYVDAKDLEALPGLLDAEWGRSAILAGGTDLLDRLKGRLAGPERVVNIKRIEALRGIERGKMLDIGALTTIAEVAADARIQRDFPVLAQAAANIATPQLRNMGTIGGNLCQRPRCWYFRGSEYPCLKKGGDTCYAVDGLHKYHAIFGGGPCFIVHPSDSAPALRALGARLEIYGPDGSRQVRVEDFFRLPEDSLDRENILKSNEIITRIRVPRLAKGSRSTYVKFREKQSLDFAIASVAAVLEMDGERVGAASIVLGGVAPIPWRVEAAQAELEGRTLSATTIQKAADAAVAEADPLEENGYKVQLTRNLVRRALESLAG